jgi:type IV secretion system protein VirD4
VLALFAAVSALVWGAGQVAGGLFGAGRPAAALAETPAIAVRLREHLSDPAAAWPAVDGARLPGAVGFYAAAVIVTLAITALAWATLTLWNRIRRSRVDGARFATRRDLAPLTVRRAEPRRMIVGRAGGRLVATRERDSLIVLGPTQSGKTSGLVIPAILEWQGVVIASSVKQDLLEHTIGHRAGPAGHVYIYDPTATTGLGTHTWSPIHAAATWQGAQRTARMLTTGRRTTAGAAEGDFWAAAAGELLAPILLAAAHADRTMGDVMRWLKRQEHDEIIDILAAAGEDAAVDSADANSAREQRQRSSIYTTAEIALQVFQDPAVLASAATCQITPNRLLDGRANTLYLCGPTHEQDRVRPLLETLLEQIIAEINNRAASGRRANQPILLVLDEAANIAAPPHLDVLLSTAAALGVQVITVWQDLAQLHARYGPQRAQTILNNSRARIVLSGISDTTTLDEVGRLLGDTTVAQPHITHDAHGGTSTGEGVAYRPLAPADLLRQLPPNEGLLIYGHLPPARIRLRPWWRDRALTQRQAGTHPAVQDG